MAILQLRGTERLSPGDCVETSQAKRNKSVEVIQVKTYVCRGVAETPLARPRVSCFVLSTSVILIKRIGVVEATT